MNARPTPPPVLPSAGAPNATKAAARRFPVADPRPTTLQPDQSTGQSDELSMHPGMDGAHDMTIHVPVQYADRTTSVLDLAVTGDFRD